MTAQEMEAIIMETQMRYLRLLVVLAAAAADKAVKVAVLTMVQLEVMGQYFSFIVRRPDSGMST